jgi:hypothetical protein
MLPVLAELTLKLVTVPSNGTCRPGVDAFEYGR